MHKIILAGLLSLTLASGAALADKGGKHGHGGGNDRDDRYEERDRRDDRGGRDYRDDRRSGGASIEFRFGDGDRRAISDYYGGQFRGGNCPPGLAKKGNGCQPPGQVKKWAMGRPLARDVEHYPLPRDLLVRLPVPPAGHEYVRVAGDILMIAVGTSLVVDAIQDIGR